MAQVVAMPKLGFDMAEGTLVRWVILEGDSVSKGKVLAEIETDKATVEVESAYDGVLLRHLVAEGDIVPVNTPIAVVGAAGEKVDLSALGFKAGGTIAAEKPGVEETSVTVQLSPEVVEQSESFDSDLPGGVRASPLARRIASDRGIDLRQVAGSGPAGRITKADVESFQTKLASVQPAVAPVAPAPVSAAKPAMPPAPLPTLPAIGLEPRQDQIVSLSRLRSAIGRRMVEAKQATPHFYVTHEYDMAKVMSLRKQINALLPEPEKISVNDFILKAVALCLRQFPNLNASLDQKNNQVVRHGQIHMGVAVAVENGLLTVVVRDADAKLLRLIALEVKNLVERAREGKVRPEDIEGSTFSISNLGMYDVEHFIAIINPPEAAILAVGSVREVPVVEQGEIKPGLRMKATLSVDHRISDGVEAAYFLQELGRYLEEPVRLML